MKVLKTSLFLFIVVIVTNLAWALFYYNTQMAKVRQTEAQTISKDCQVASDLATCVYVQVRLGGSQFEKDLLK